MRFSVRSLRDRFGDAEERVPWWGWLIFSDLVVISGVLFIFTGGRTGTAVALGAAVVLGDLAVVLWARNAGLLPTPSRRREMLDQRE